MTYFITYNNNYIHLPNVNISKVDKRDFKFVADEYKEFVEYITKNSMVKFITTVFRLPVGEQPKSPVDSTILKCLANPYDDTEHDYYLQTMTEHLYRLFVMQRVLNHNDVPKDLRAEYDALRGLEKPVNSYTIDTFCDKFNTFLSEDNFIYDDCINHRPVYNTNDIAAFLTEY